MNKHGWLMLFGGACLWGVTPVATAHDRGSTTMRAAACSSCHTGGPAPQVEFSSEAGAPFAGNRLIIKRGATARLFLHVDTQPGFGVGLLSQIPDAFTLRSGHALTRVERGLLFHRTTIAAETGRNSVELWLTATPRALCGHSFSIPVYAAAVNKNRAPSGDGAAQGSLQVSVECDAAAPAAEPAAPAPAPVKSLEGKLAAPVRDVPAAVTTDAQVSAGAPHPPLSSAVTLSPRQLESQGVRLNLAVSGQDSGAMSLAFAMGAKHVVIDCRVRGLPKLHFSVRDSRQNLESELAVDGQEGHFYMVVPGRGLARNVRVSISADGLAQGFQSCTLTPTL